MAVLVHLTSQKQERSIRRHGLEAGRHGLFAVPVTADFMASHQWARELKRFGGKLPLAVCFRVPSDAGVRAGLCNGEQVRAPLRVAIGAYLKGNQPQGFELILETDVPASQILKTKRLRRPVGWRFYPQAKGNRPIPDRGELAAAKTRRRLDMIG